MWWLAVAASAEPLDHEVVLSVGTGNHFGAGALGTEGASKQVLRPGGNFRWSVDRRYDLDIGLGMSGIAVGVGLHPAPGPLQPFFVSAGVAPLLWAGKGYVWERNNLPYMYGPDVRAGVVVGDPIAVTVGAGIGAVNVPLFGLLTSPVVEVGVGWRFDMGTE
jgi:hypothetical protein